MIFNRLHDLVNHRNPDFYVRYYRIENLVAMVAVATFCFELSK
jgi:hypothetical protein